MICSTRRVIMISTPRLLPQWGLSLMLKRGFREIGVSWPLGVSSIPRFCNMNLRFLMSSWLE